MGGCTYYCKNCALKRKKKREVENSMEILKASVLCLF